MLHTYFSNICYVISHFKSKSHQTKSMVGYNNQPNVFISENGKWQKLKPIGLKVTCPQWSICLDSCNLNPFSLLSSFPSSPYLHLPLPPSPYLPRILHTLNQAGGNWQPDGVAKWVERPFPVLGDREPKPRGFESWSSQTYDFKNWYLSLLSLVLDIIRIG